MAADFTTDVLVVGAGPVGLALGLELGRRGHRVHIVEAADRIGRQPRAKTTNVRSMEHFRRWGLADRVRAAAPLPASHANRIVFATGLFGKTITSFENAFNADRERDARFSEAAQWIPQYEIEAVLRDAALAQPTCTLSLNRTFRGLAQDADGVTAEIVPTGSDEAEIIRARHLVGADGARSRVRQALGIVMEGDGRIGNFLSLVLRVPGLAVAEGLGDALMYWLINPASPCVCGPMDRDDTWFWGTQVPPDAALDEAGLRARVEAWLGRAMPFEILVSDVWSALRLQAASYGAGRVHLAGDACHLHPPFGGHGMNLGIADAVDLGWKLAAGLEGWGGPSLLASYEAERRPVHARVIAESVENMGALMQHFLDPALDADGEAGIAARAAAAAAIQRAKAREFHSLGLVLGYDYAGSPIIVSDGGAPPLAEPGYRASASPGRRAPHAWLADGTSLFDHFGAGFTLLRLDDGADGEADALLAAARDAGLPLSVVAPREPGLAALHGARLALIRPDQHIAWRGDAIVDPAAIIARVRGA